MKKYGLLAVAVSISCSAWAGQSQFDKLYGVDESNDDLVLIDPTTAQVDSIGPLGLASVSSLASDAGGVLYGTDTYSLNLVTIDKQSGAASIVGPTYSGEITALAFSPEGSLYGAEAFADTLLTLDPVTGMASVVGDFGLSDRIITGLAFDPEGVLYGVASGNTTAVDSLLVVIDLASGAATTVGSMGMPYVTGLSFRRDGTLYGVSRQNDALLSIDTSNGTATNLGSPLPSDRWLGGIEFVSVDVEFDIKRAGVHRYPSMKSKGVIPVSIYGSDHLDVEQIDPGTLSLSGLQLKSRGKHLRCSFDELNYDGILDLMCHFEFSIENWMPAEDRIELTGELYDGTPIAGTQPLCRK